MGHSPTPTTTTAPPKFEAQGRYISAAVQTNSKGRRRREGGGGESSHNSRC